MRIVKEAEEKRNEILDVAEELFALKGYDATSTNDIPVVDRIVQSKIVPIITKLVEEGIEEGIFKTDYPKQTVEMLLLYSAEAFDAQNELTNEQMLERMNAFIYNTERLLGAKSGSMTESMKQIFDGYTIDRIKR